MLIRRHYSAPVHPVGRESEERELRRWIDEALRGDPRLVLITGEAGIGKTYVVDDLQAALVAEETLTARGLVSEHPGAPPFWPWRQIEAQLGAEGLFGEIVGSDPEADRFARFDEVSRWLKEQAVDARGVVVVLEDVHRSDLPSLRVLAHVAQQLRDEPVALIATHRSDPSDYTAGFAEVLDQLRRLPLARRTELRGLSVDSVAALLDVDTPPHVVQHVYEVTGGNPLFVRELALHLSSGGEPTSVPASVRDAVAVRLAQRSSPCVEALRVAAVIGRDFAAGLVATVLGRPALTVLDAMDEAVSAGLIEPLSTPGRFRFVHILVRDAVEATLSAAALPGVHRQVAEAIEAYEGSSDDRLADLARHWDEASVLGDRDVAAAWCERAADAADRRLAWEEAARLFDRALAIGGPAADPLDRYNRIVGGARARLNTDVLEVVVAQCVEASVIADRIQRPDLMAEAALVPEGRGGSEATWIPLRAITEAALAAINGDNHVLRARLLGQLATLAFYLDPSQCDELSAAALTAADLADDPLAVVAATRARQMLRAVPDGAEERLALAQRIGDAGRALRRAGITIWEAIWTIDALLELGRVPEATATLPDLRRRVGETRLPIAQWHLARVEAVLAQATGRFPEALEAGARARDLFAVLETPLGAENMYLGIRTEIAHHVGFDDAIVDGWAPVLGGDLPPFLDELPLLGPLIANTSTGHLDVARSLYSALTPVRTWNPPRFIEIPLLAVRTLAAIALGLEDDIALLLERLAPHRGHHVTSSGGSVNYSGCVDRFLGKGHMALGHWNDAIAELRHALAIAVASGTPGYAVETAADLAHALTERGQPGDAEEAADLVDRYLPKAVDLGMAPWIERFDAISQRTAPPPDDGPLSPRELEVAGLVAGGLTNKQIASQLFLSERTAQNHVHHILTKLGLTNRTQIAAWYRER